MGDICKTTDSEYIKLEQSHDLEFHHDQQYFNFEEHKSYLLNDFEGRFILQHFIYLPEVG